MADAAPAPPVAPIEPELFEAFGRRRLDNYNWLRNRDDPRVLSYLKAENAYAETRLAELRPLVDAIAAELEARAAAQDASVPLAHNGYIYERHYARGAPYPLIVRRKDLRGSKTSALTTEDDASEIVLDVAALAAGRSQYRLGDWTVSPDNRRVAFAVDFTGDLEYRVFVRTIATGEVVDQGIADAAGNLVFSADSSMLFYVRNEPETLRSYQVWRHTIGAGSANDVLVYEERDPAYSVSIDLSKSRKYVLLSIDEERTTETRYLPVDRPTEDFKVIEPRRFGIRYEVDHVGDTFFIRTNLGAADFRLMSAPEATPDAAHWSELVPETAGHFFSHFEAFERFVALDFEHQHGTQLRVFRLPDMHEIAVPRPAAAGVASCHFDDDSDLNVEPSSTALRMHFSSLTQPQRIYDFDVTTGALTLRKEDAASRWFDSERYALDRLAATAADGERVPVTIVYRKDLRQAGGNPTLIAGYGAYGYSFRPTFEADIVSLLDRGFVYAIAHVRGGRERGERWYVDGRVLKKRNTFTDFIAATEALIAHGYAAPRAVFAQGRSAGGLLMGALANLRPDLYAGIVAEVPFVDVVTTMSNAAVPLTTLEYNEWGNPAVQREYDYMLSYSPYDNVVRKSYPAMFVTAGFNDSQVSYAEPAKWVAKLRAARTDGRDLIFKTDLGAGHGGRSGRLGSVVETAEIMAWLIAQARDRAKA